MNLGLPQNFESQNPTGYHLRCFKHAILGVTSGNHGDNPVPPSRRPWPGTLRCRNASVAVLAQNVGHNRSDPCKHHPQIVISVTILMILFYFAFVFRSLFFCFWLFLFPLLLLTIVVICCHHHCFRHVPRAPTLKSWCAQKCWERPNLGMVHYTVYIYIYIYIYIQYRERERDPKEVGDWQCSFLKAGV